MKKHLTFILSFTFMMIFSQIENIKNGERIMLRIHYGFLNAGYATLTANQVNYRNAPHYRVTV